MVLNNSIVNYLYSSSWRWHDVAVGHIAGHKVVQTLSKEKHSINFCKLITTTYDSYRWYNQAAALGFLQGRPGFVKILKYSIITLSVANLLTAIAVKWLNHLKTPSLPVPKIVSKITGLKIRPIPGGPYWSFTQKLHAIGVIVETSLGIQKEPLKAIAFFTSAVVTILDRRKALSKELTLARRWSPLISHAIILRSDSWNEKVVTAIKLL